MTENIVSKPPLNTSMVEKNGKPSKTWAIWFRDLYTRTSYKGGNSIDENKEFAESIESDLIDTNSSLEETVEAVNINIVDIAVNEQDISDNKDLIGINIDDIETNETAISDEIIRATTEEVRIFDILKTQYQCLKNGTQSTTGSYAALTGWTESKNIGGFTLNSGNGTIAFDNSGEYELSIWCMGDDAGGVADSQLDIKVQKDPLGVGSFADVVGAKDSQYINKDATINLGSAQINNFQLTVIATDLIRVMIQHKGAAVDILSNNARLSIRRIS